MFLYFSWNALAVFLAAKWLLEGSNTASQAEEERKDIKSAKRQKEPSGGDSGSNRVNGLVQGHFARNGGDQPGGGASV